MAQRTIRFKDETEALIEERAKGEGRSFAGWVKRAVEKALGDGGIGPSSKDDRGSSSTSSPVVDVLAPPRRPRKTSSQRTPPRPQPREQARMARSEAIAQGMMAAKQGMDIQARMSSAVSSSNPITAGEAIEHETPPGCAECGGDIAVHPEFGRYCTGCGARVR